MAMILGMVNTHSNRIRHRKHRLKLIAMIPSSILLTQKASVGKIMILSPPLLPRTGRKNSSSCNTFNLGTVMTLGERVRDRRNALSVLYVM